MVALLVPRGGNVFDNEAFPLPFPLILLFYNPFTLKGTGERRERIFLYTRVRIREYTVPPVPFGDFRFKTSHLRGNGRGNVELWQTFPSAFRLPVGELFVTVRAVVRVVRLR